MNEDFKVELAPERIRSAGPQAREHFFSQLPEPIRPTLIELSIVFLTAYLLLFCGMTRRPGMYDEGIMLTGAMRVAAGQIPHRDFYFIYGPAEPYILAGLFRIFGPSLLAERLFDLLIKGLVVASVYAIVRSYCRRPIAIFVSALSLFWIFGVSEFGLATTPVSLLDLVSSALVLPIFSRSLPTRRMLAAGAVAGLALLFRYDTGIALLAIHLLVISTAVFLKSKNTATGLRSFASAVWPYLLGFALLTVPAAIYYFSVASAAPLLHDILLYPSKYYRRDRSLPFPRTRRLENLGIYLPIIIAGFSLYALVKVRFGRSGDGVHGVREVPQARQWQGYLLMFGLLLSVMYLKGLVRVSLIQIYLAIIPSLLLIAVLFERRSHFSRPVQVSISCLMWLSLVAAMWSSIQEIEAQHAEHVSAETKKSWCTLTNPLTEGYCFLPEEDRIHAIEFIASHTQPGQPLYSGLKHHDRVYANDNLIYFATQRLPVTRWSHFDPDLQNHDDIQRQMIQEMQRNPPPIILLDSEFDLMREPNGSARSSGVKLLDTYIEDHYQPSETFGAMSIWQRDDLAGNSR
jgi:hypothetical protein